MYGPELLTFDGSASSDPQAAPSPCGLVGAPSGFENDLFDPGVVGQRRRRMPQAFSSTWPVTKVQLQVRTATRTGAPSVSQVAAVPENAIHVELFWDEVAADLDLHFAQEGYELFQSPGDVNWCNPNPEWKLDRDRRQSVPRTRRRRRPDPKTSTCRPSRRRLLHPRAPLHGSRQRRSRHGQHLA